MAALDASTSVAGSEFVANGLALKIDYYRESMEMIKPTMIACLIAVGCAIWMWKDND